MIGPLNQEVSMSIRSRLPLVLIAAIVLPACGDQAAAPTEANPVPRPVAQAVIAAQEPFTFRAPLEPYRVNQAPDFMIHSRARTDIVIQRNVFTSGAGGWHTHPGLTFVVVTQGQIKLTQVKADGCVDTEVFGPGDVYFEEGGEVHRATVLSAEDAVLLVTRFNIPVGGAITTPAADPGC
jgi:hypothetical protein